jgi:alpha-galactosidase
MIRFVLPSALLAMALACSARAAGPVTVPDEMVTSADFWKPEHAPFSFTYDGKPSSQILSSWKMSQGADTAVGGGHLRRYLYTDPVTKLTVIAEVRTFDHFPAVDWVVKFRNAGTIDTPIIENIRALQLSLPAAGDCIVHHARGSTADAQDFAPLNEHVSPGGNLHFESSNGRSSDGASVPIFNLEIGDHGVIEAIGWTGRWQADFALSSGALPTFSASAGMIQTHLSLHPGEEIRTPRIVLMNWAGGDWQDAQNTWRRLVLASYSPHDNGRPMLGPVLTSTWGGEASDKKADLIKWTGEQHIPLSVYAIDAGWYGQSSGDENDTINPWWNCRGDWFPNAKNYPLGMGTVGDACKAAGIGFSLWFEPETAMPNTKIIIDHPDWFLHTDHPVNPGVSLANLALPAVREGLTKMLSTAISDYGMTWYRQDFNINPDAYWATADPPDRIGMTEIGHVEGLYQMWDDLLRTHPGLHIDNCSSGGRRLDIEMMSRSYAVWRTDHGDTDPLAEQAQTQALSPWVPLTMAEEAYTAPDPKPWDQPGPYDTSEHRYLMRLGYSTGYGLEHGYGRADLNNPEWVAWIRRTLAEFHEVQPYFYGDFYALQPYSLANDAWSAWQWDRPEQKDGIVILLRRPGSAMASMTLNLHRLDPDAIYEVEIRPTYDKAPAQEMKGGDLAKLQIQLPDAPSSQIIFYRKI